MSNLVSYLSQQDLVPEEGYRNVERKKFCHTDDNSQELSTIEWFVDLGISVDILNWTAFCFSLSIGSQIFWLDIGLNSFYFLKKLSLQTSKHKTQEF